MAAGALDIVDTDMDTVMEEDLDFMEVDTGEADTGAGVQDTTEVDLFFHAGFAVFFHHLLLLQFMSVHHQCTSLIRLLQSRLLYCLEC